jgi:ferrochelatase
MSFRPRFAPEPPFSHGAPPASSSPSTSATAVLLCNLGTPDEPTAPALRRYLAEFLSDPRVVEIPKPLWWLILHGIILRVRPKKVGGQVRQHLDERRLAAAGLDAETGRHAARLPGGARPGCRRTLRHALRHPFHRLAARPAQGRRRDTRVLILPAYPQYSGTTTASVFDAVYAWAARIRRIPEFRFVNHYHDHAGYIAALAARVREHWRTQGRAEQLVMSFHGVPERTLKLGDPYHCECHKTARLLASQLGLEPTQYKVTFQSRFGKAKWLQPYTEPTLVAMAQAGVKRVDVICPGFTGDCLETLEEINMEAREAFLHAGGAEFHYIPCLNDSHEWIAGLAEVAQQHLAGWPVQQADAAEAAKALAASRERALALGAAK